MVDDGDGKLSQRMHWPRLIFGVIVLLAVVAVRHRRSPVVGIVAECASAANLSVRYSKAERTSA